MKELSAEVFVSKAFIPQSFELHSLCYIQSILFDGGNLAYGLVLVGISKPQAVHRDSFGSQRTLAIAPERLQPQRTLMEDPSVSWDLHQAA